MQNNALIDGSLRNRIEQVDGKFKRMLLYQNDSAIKENEILNLSSDDYQILEIHCGFEANIKRACFALKGNNIVLDYVGVGSGADALSFTASRPYLFQSATAYKAGIAVLRRFSGNYEKSYAWLNISAIYGLKFN